MDLDDKHWSIIFTCLRNRRIHSRFLGGTGSPSRPRPSAPPQRRRMERRNLRQAPPLTVGFPVGVQGVQDGGLLACYYSPKRDDPLACLADIRRQASLGGHHLLILGDANAAPENGRWHCPRHSRLHASDARVIAWAQQHGLTEVPRPRMIPTWRASLKRCSTKLDRTWFSPTTLGISKVNTRWADVAAQFDHALLYVQLPSRVAGTGFAGVCRDGWRERPAPRLRVDMQLLKARRDEFALAVTEEKKTFQGRMLSLSPFEALTAVNEISSRVAQHLAPCAFGYLASGLR
jgi:hypothetical protein